MTDAAAPRPRDGSLADLEQFWARSAVGWHAVYLGLLGLVAALVAVTLAYQRGILRTPGT